MEFIRKNINASNNGTNGGINSGVQNTATNTTLETHTIFGQPYNGTNDVRGNLSDVNKISANGDISTDGDLIIKGIDDEGVYTDKDLKISKDSDGTNFTGGEGYHFDNTVSTNYVDSESGYFKDLGAESLASAFAYFTEMMAEKGTINNLNTKKILADDISVDTLTVTKAAHFFSLIIDEIKSVGGQVILSPANATLDLVRKTDGGNYKCYFRAQVGDDKISNQFAANDQVVCQTFNVAEGTSYNISNTFYWRLLNSRGRENINGIDYHYIILSGTDCAKGSAEPKEGDRVVALGNRKDQKRQNAIVLSAYNSDFLDKGLQAPSFVQYKGINDYNLTTHRWNVISNGLNQFIGDFKVTSGESVTDMIQANKYNRLILDKALAVVGSDDVLSIEVSGRVLPLSGKKYTVEYMDSPTRKFSFLMKNDTFNFKDESYQTNYSTQLNPVTNFYISLLQEGTVIERVCIPVIFETSAVLTVMEDKIETAVQNVEGDISRVEQKADSITTTVQNMKVGGQNLLNDSEFKTYKNGNIWNVQNGEVASRYGYKNQLGIHAISMPYNVNENGYFDLAQQTITNLEPDTYYTFSFYAKGVNGVTADKIKYKGRVSTYVYPDLGAEIADNYHTFQTNSNWKRYYYTFKTRSTVSPKNKYNLLFRLISDTIGDTTYYSNTYISMPKLEEGTMPTAWDVSGEDVKSFITQTADSIEAKIVSEDTVKSLISQNDSHIKAEVFDEMNKATGIDVTKGSITLNADKTTIKGNLNITDTQNGFTVFETASYNGNNTLIPRINLQPKQVADFAEMAQDKYTFFTKSIYQTNNNTWSLNFGSNDYTCKKDDVFTFDYYTLLEIRSDDSGGTNPPYSNTCKVIIQIAQVNGSTATEQARMEVTLNKQNDYGKYFGNEVVRFAVPKDGTYRVSASSVFTQSAVGNYPKMNGNLSMRIQIASKAITYIGTDGMYCHSGANKCLYVNEKSTVIQHGFNGVKWDNTDAGGNRTMKVVTGITGASPNLQPVWFPFYNYTPIFMPYGDNVALTKIVNDGNSYNRYAYKINPLKDNGICYLESAFMDSSLNPCESWVLLPPSDFYDENGKQISLPMGYTVTVINGGFGNNKFNAYVSANVDKSHKAVFIDGHRDKNWKVSLNNTVHWEKFVYMGSYYSSDCDSNQDVWMTLQDGQ